MRRIPLNIPSSLFLVPCFFILLLPACSDGNSKRVVKHTQLKGVWHLTLAGDTVSKLARAYKVAAADIEEINGLGPSGKLKRGQKVFIPGGKREAGTAPVVTAPEPAPVRSPAASQPASMATKKKGGASSGKKKKGAVRFIWPVSKGKLSSRYGKRGKKIHEGIDIAAAEGTAILAAANGTVIYEGEGLKGYGKLIIIRHRAGLVSVYAHNKRNLVREGVVVKQGQVIAEVGHTGRTTGDHLHFEIRRGEKPLNPERYVRAR